MGSVRKSPKHSGSSPEHAIPSGNVPIFLPECGRLSLILLGVAFILASLISIGVFTDLYNVFRWWPYGAVCLIGFVVGAVIVGLGCRCWLKEPIITASVQMKMLQELDRAEQEAKLKKRDSIRRIYHKMSPMRGSDRRGQTSSVSAEAEV